MFSRNPNYELNLSGILPVFSPSGKQYLSTARISGGDVAALKVNTPELGRSEVLYQPAYAQKLIRTDLPEM